MKIIAEIGINHNGVYEEARELVLAASSSGVSGVKFQYRNTKNSYIRSNHKEIGDEILLEEIDRNYLPPEQVLSLAALAKENNLEAGISFFNRADIEDFSDSIRTFDFFKIPSVELQNYELIDALLSINKHLYLSLGAHTEDQIIESLSRLPVYGWTPMHCVSNYPLAVHNTNLGYIDYLAHVWQRNVGYSSHDADWEVCLFAIHKNVSVIERHITFNKNSSGLDHTSSSTPDEFKKLVFYAKHFEKINSGNGPRIINQGEKLNLQNLGRSFYSRKRLSPGHVIQRTDFDYSSPQIGLNRVEFELMIGNKIERPIEKNEALTKYHFEHKKFDVSPEVIQTCIDCNISIPVRVHDYQKINSLMPLGSYELHLSFGEVMAGVPIDMLDSQNSYSIHLPDYINSTQLIDPLSAEQSQAKLSLKIISKVVALAKLIEDKTASPVPIVGSFSVSSIGRNLYYERYSQLFSGIESDDGIRILPQWLPPIAWYFGGSVELGIMNCEEDANMIINYELPFCMDLCHMILGRNYFEFDANKMLKKLFPHVAHCHLADAIGVDGEGVSIGEGPPENLPLIRALLKHKSKKVIEVWQGHLNNFSGFKNELEKIHRLVAG